MAARNEKPVAIPAKRIGSPSKIKHVFVIIRENRTYDQILGDVTRRQRRSLTGSLRYRLRRPGLCRLQGNAQRACTRASVSRSSTTSTTQAASRPTVTTGSCRPWRRTHDDIQSHQTMAPRLPLQRRRRDRLPEEGHPLGCGARAAGVSFKNYGEYIEYNTFTVAGCTPTPGSSCEPQWIDFYNDTLAYESGAESRSSTTSTRCLALRSQAWLKITVQNYPQFDLGIPDQFRFDVWAAGLPPGCSCRPRFPSWNSCGSALTTPADRRPAYAMQADNDLALGRFMSTSISHSSSLEGLIGDLCRGR